jgi:hypothetical protein
MDHGSCTKFKLVFLRDLQFSIYFFLFNILKGRGF